MMISSTEPKGKGKGKEQSKGKGKEQTSSASGLSPYGGKGVDKSKGKSKGKSEEPTGKGKGKGSKGKGSKAATVSDLTIMHLEGMSATIERLQEENAGLRLELATTSKGKGKLFVAYRRIANMRNSIEEVEDELESLFF